MKPEPRQKESRSQAAKAEPAASLPSTPPPSLQAVRKSSREPGGEPVMVHEVPDTTPETDWEDEMANHKDEYQELPTHLRAQMQRDLNDHLQSGDYDEYPEDWIERSNKLAAQEDD